ncbi:MAG TPA: hypothetical protein VGN56_00070, partial [Candidatus Paceibacterota bacterium]|nr:hypothetical protein [Candidatus Paceibacterota bacterium]
EEDIRAKQKIVESLEMAAERRARGIGMHETAAFQAHNGGTVQKTPEQELLEAESELKSLYEERHDAKKPGAEAANDNADEAEEVTVPIVQEEDTEMEAHSYGPNVIDLAAKRQERMEKKQAQRKHNFLTAAIIGLFGLNSAAGAPIGKSYAPEKQKPAAASSHAPGPATKLQQSASRVELGPVVQGLHQNAISPRSAPNPIIVQRQQHAAEMAHHHASNARAEAVARSHRTGAADPDRSEEIAAIYAKQHAGAELRDRGLPPHTDPENFTAFRAEIDREIREKKEVPGEHVAPTAPTASAAPAAEAPHTPTEQPAPPAEKQEKTAPKPAAQPASEIPSPSHQESAPTVTSNESKNMHGLSIDRTTAHMYEDANGIFIAYGGSYDQQVSMANDFLKRKQNYGKAVLVMSRTSDPMTGRPDVSAYSTDASGQIEFRPVLTDEGNMPILPPADDDLVKLVL